MKRTSGIILAVFALLMLTASLGAAQVQYSIGAKGGVNFANISGDDVENNKSFTAFAAGAAGMAKLSPNFGIGLEVLYSRKGAKDELTDETLKIDYIEVPVLATGIYPVDEKVALMAYAGPAIAFTMSADVEPATGESEDIKDLITSTDIGGAFGGGAIFDAGQVKISVEGRWTLGFMSIDDSDADADIKNSVIGALVGVYFPLGGSGAAE